MKKIPKKKSTSTEVQRQTCKTGTCNTWHGTVGSLTTPKFKFLEFALPTNFERKDELDFENFKFKKPQKICWEHLPCLGGSDIPLCEIVKHEVININH